MRRFIPLIRVPRRLKLTLLALVLVLLPALPVLPASGAPAAPVGVTAIALNGQANISWKSVSGATSYRIFRSSTLGGTYSQVGTSTAPTFTNTGLTNGTTYYYNVRAVDILGQGAASASAQVTPLAQTCSTGNQVAVENCFAGTTAWKSTGGPQIQSGGIEGFATKTSINRGESVDLKVNTQDAKPYRVEIYRTGWYDGDQGRLISVIPGLVGDLQSACNVPAGNTGLTDCSNWTATSTLTTSASWPSGVYILRLVRTDNGADNHVLLTVRDDARTPAVSYIVPVAHYSAYNNYGGKSLYDFNSNGATTVAGTPRAVKVSLDRPQNLLSRDWYTDIDVQNVGWLERGGYDLSYATSVDLQAGIPNLNNREAIVSGSHDEYWSSQMRTAATNARNAGTGLLFLGANGVYWKIRYESSPVSGDTNRVVVCYKSTQSGAPDPLGPTGTWRDPAGANQPENALMGVQYIGDNDFGYSPMRVSATEGKHRMWRYTPLGSLAAGTTETIGQNLMGWEWDARAANGAEPAGIATVASTPVTGSILQDAGRVYAPGSAVAHATYYKAPGSGGVVFSSGTNHWSRGLGMNEDNVGEPNTIIMQATANALQDMGARPTTPDNVILDGTAAPTVSTRAPVPGATNVATTTAVTATFDSPVDPSTVTNSSFTLTRPGGATVAATVTYSDATKTATLTPTGQLDGVTTYTATLTTAIKNWNGQALAAPSTWSFTTRSGSPPTVTGRTPAPGATAIAFNEKPTATFDRDMAASTITNTSFTLTPSGGTAVAATVAYNSATRTATLTPSALLNASTTYTARVTTAAQATDGAPLASDVTWSFTTKASLGPFTITDRAPAPLASGISPSTTVRAVFSRSADAATLTPSTFTLKDSGGASVSATVAYNDATKTATLTPSGPLTLMTTYTATLTTGVKAAEDGQPLGSAVTWTFTTATSPPPPPAVTATNPLASATGVALNSQIRATFDRSLDPATVTNETFTVSTGGGPPVVASVSYDDATRVATLTPSAPLGVSTTYTARVTTAVRSTTGAPMSSDVAWTFTTVDCPCSIFPSTLTPTGTGLTTQDGRTGPGPWTYELGVKFTVDSAVQLTALKFYKDAAETGTHVGRLWTTGGTQLASVTYTNETASGWQKQNLASPVNLSPGNVYIASVGVNSRWVWTQSGLASPVVSGPLRTVADGFNGVYAPSAGQLPTNSWSSSNYFVDVSVKGAGTALPTPHVIGQVPASGSSGADPAGTVRATFDVDMDAATINASTFTLTTAGGSAVAASVSYNQSTRIATLTPNAELASNATYTARVTTGARSDEGQPLASAVTWNFTTASQPPPTVTSTTPSDGATLVSRYEPLRAVFSQAMDAATISGSTFTLQPSAGGAAVSASVTYNSVTRTATLQPTTALAATTSYTAQLSSGIRNSQGVALAPASWSFTTSACPCRLFTDAQSPAVTELPTQDGRSGAGPWSYELGVKIRVTQAAELSAIRYWKSPSESGTHVGRVWTAAGAQIATTTFGTPTASGWQEQALATPVDLVPGQTYVVSVGFNAAFSLTGAGLASEIVSGPLRSVADGANGVYGAAAGTFPTSSWNNSNYFVDPVAR